MCCDVDMRLLRCVATSFAVEMKKYEKVSSRLMFQILLEMLLPTENQTVVPSLRLLLKSGTRLASSARVHDMAFIANKTLPVQREDSCNCENNSTCLIIANVSSCVCKRDWVGKYCEIHAAQAGNSSFADASRKMVGEYETRTPHN